MARGPRVMAQTKETRAHMHTHTLRTILDNKAGYGWMPQLFDVDVG
jgi:hypothetical protein